MANLETERQIQIQQLRRRLGEIYGQLYAQRQPIEPIEMCVTGLGKGPDPIPEEGWQPFAPMSIWGGFDQTTWFRMRVTVPPEMRGKRVAALIRTAAEGLLPQMTGLTEGGEALAYVNRKPAHGIDRNRDAIYLVERARGGESFEIHLEACPSTRYDLRHIFMYADIAVMNIEVWDFYWDASAALDVVETLEANYAPRRQLFELVYDVVAGVDLQHIGEPPFFDSLVRQSRALKKGLAPFQQSQGMGTLVLAGHAHIDTAWLWPLRETQRKCARTFSTILALMDRYPEFHFSCSQPVQYAWMKEHYPDIFAGIKKRVREGRWELCGAPWVEPDHNIPSGESLIRQYLYGNRWFQQEFGRRSRIAWVPDSFGYNWQLPQIMTKCQLRAFITTKISWSQFSEFPYSFFLWEGADGARIPAIMPPLNYNGVVRPGQLAEQWKQFKQKEKVEQLPFPFGYGDGGGGPTMDMIEHGKRLKNMVGMPKCEFGRIEDCVERMVQQANQDELPVYANELYLEYHRGCQTTQARTKRNNRICETALHDAEVLASYAHFLGGEYDDESLVAAWKILLTNQFHDILPGTSLEEVFRQCELDYAEAKTHIEKARVRAVRHLLSSIDASGDGAPIAIFNTRSWMRTEVAQVSMKLPKGNFSVLDTLGQPVPHQRISNDALLFLAEDIPALGYAVYRIVPGVLAPAEMPSLEATQRTLENDYLRVRLNDDGTLASLFCKTEEREALPEGDRANVLQFFDDRPHLHDAWDIDHNFEDIQWEAPVPQSIELEEEGPLRASIKVVWRTERSVITQHATLLAGSPRVEFRTHVDWHERHTLLKAAFPIDVLARRAAYEIQFGTIERPTHHSEIQDRARFEVPAQRWADLSEPDFGVSLLNDCKYGYDAKGNVLRISLLRSPVDPDPEADQGEHEFTYALYPHGGDWRNGAVQQAAELNSPLLVFDSANTAGPELSRGALISVDAENVIIDGIKKHEDSKALIIRFYEAYGQRTHATFTFAKPPRRVSECDFMEENDVRLAPANAELNVFVKPYEVRALKVQF